MPFIVSRENLRLVFYVSVVFGEDFGFKMTVSSNKCKGKYPPVCMSEMIVLKLAQFK